MPTSSVGPHYEIEWKSPVVRENLKKLGGEDRHCFCGTVKRFGWKSGFKGPVETVLFAPITDVDGQVICDHLWMTVGKQLSALKCGPGDVVTFWARCTEYTKGYQGHRDDVFDKPIQRDWRLSHPTKVTLKQRAPIERDFKPDDPKPNNSTEPGSTERT
jgi:hypothetical protein